MREFLLVNGFQGSYPFYDPTMVRYTATNGNSFEVYLDEKKPNRVAALRGHKPGVVTAIGLVGEFEGSGKVGRKFSFNTPEELKNKLESWIF